MALMRPTSFVFVVSVLHASSFSTMTPLHTFEAYMEEHNRSYRKGSAEFLLRRSLFEQRVVEYKRHNGNPRRLWTAGLNALTDRTSEELASLRGWSGFVAKESTSRLHGAPRLVSHHSFGSSRVTEELPSNASWAHLESLRNVASQGGCGSCWAHATALALETNHEIKRGYFKEFSAWELVKCSSNPHHCGGSGGCDGSTAEVAMLYVMHQGLGESRACQPLSSEFLRGQLEGTTEWESILLPGTHVVPDASPARQLGLVGWERLPENRAEPLMQAVVDWGPVAVSVAGSYFSGYERGVFDDCPRDVIIDHAVTLIGFGRHDGLLVNYWHIRNSWGQRWGENGNIRLLRSDSDDEFCGEDGKPDFGTGCNGGPKRVTVCGMCGILYDSVLPHFSA